MGSILVCIIFVLVLISLRRFQRLWLVLVVILNKCWFPLITISLAAFIFSGLPQGRDIISQIEFNSKILRNFTSPIALWFWAFNCWKMSSTVLELVGTYNLAGKKNTIANLISTLFPLLIGVMPIILSVTIFLVYQVSPDPVILGVLIAECWFFPIYILLELDFKHETDMIRIDRKVLHILSLYLFVGYGYLRTAINDTFNKLIRRKQQLEIESRIHKSDLKIHWQKNMTGERFVNWALHVVVFVLVAAYPIYFSQIIGPIGLVFIAFSMSVIIATNFAYLRRLTGQPFFKVIIITAIVFTLVNDNNLVGKLKSNEADEREELNAHFEKWLLKKSGTEDTITVSLVAAEGGGLRSSYWTYSVLRQLQLDDPKFKDDLFAISTVSGGSIGAGLFCSELLTGLSKKLEDAPIINEDNLSPMIAGLFYREILQSVIPYPVVALDRSRIMDETFALNWRKKHPGDKKWDEHFLDLWKKNPDLPSVFINSTHVESGSGAVFSNLRFDSTQIQAIDMMHLMENTLSFSTVLGISARVPVFEPVAKFDQQNGDTWGHLGDGGYSENSGISSIYQVYLNLRKQADGLIKEGKIKAVRFSILFIGNVKREKDAPCNLLNELRMPLNTISASWRTRSLSFERIAKVTMPQINKSDRYFEIRLDRKKSALPLGWFFSNRSRADMISQANALHENADYKAYFDFMYGK